ncbi:MAG: patatin-like phospholipase family protein [Candidatus Scalindua sp.]|nr:patatin-like phospholipase family protein [Candidatus Scalindua sp.]
MSPEKQKCTDERRSCHDVNEPITLMLLGGGVRCHAFIGALSALEEKGLNISKIVVASGGSLVGSLYATGKSPLEIKKIAMELDSSLFRDFSILSLLRGKGLYEGKVLENWIDKKLDGRTFRDNFCIPPFIIATDILNNKPFVFSCSNFPDLKVSKAVRFSIGIPWVYAYKHFNHNGNRHIYIDGNLMSGVVEDMFERQGKTLIFRIISNRSFMTSSPKHFTLKKYIQRLLLMQLHAVERERVKRTKWNDTILIFCGDIPPTKFSLSKDEKLYLFDQGYQQSKKFIEYKWGV